MDKELRHIQLMSHFDYYRYQAKARGIRHIDDVITAARDKEYIYEQIVLQWLPADGTAPIAEVACGHGSFLHWLKSRDYNRIVGVDSSREQIDLARQVGVTVFHNEVNAWLSEQPDATQQTIVAIDFIEHISKDEMMVFLKESRRVLVDGGCLILRYPNGDSPLVGMNLFNDITHVWTYTPNCLNSLGMMHGYSRSLFEDESAGAIRDKRWLKVPLCRISQAMLGFLFRAATREKVDYWSPHMWACLIR